MKKGEKVLFFELQAGKVLKMQGFEPQLTLEDQLTGPLPRVLFVKSDFFRDGS
jgi:hypothetical protein